MFNRARTKMAIHKYTKWVQKSSRLSYIIDEYLDGANEWSEIDTVKKLLQSYGEERIEYFSDIVMNDTVSQEAFDQLMKLFGL